MRKHDEVIERIEEIKPFQKTHTMQEVADLLGITKGRVVYAVKLGNLSFKPETYIRRSSLEESDIPLIMELRKTLPIGDIARKFEVTNQTISNVINKVTWKNVPR